MAAWVFVWRRRVPLTDLLAICANANSPVISAGLARVVTWSYGHARSQEGRHPLSRPDCTSTHGMGRYRRSWFELGGGDGKEGDEYR